MNGGPEGNLFPGKNLPGEAKCQLQLAGALAGGSRDQNPVAPDGAGIAGWAGLLHRRHFFFDLGDNLAVFCGGSLNKEGFEARTRPRVGSHHFVYPAEIQLCFQEVWV